MSSPAAPASEPRTVWVVSDGRRGIENQALGLAEAVSRQMHRPATIEKVVVRKDGFVTLPAHSVPDLWIGCGRQAVALAARHRRTFPDAFYVYVQDPRGHYGDFDLVVAPGHDRLVRENAVAMTGSPNRVTRQVLEEGRSAFSARIEALPGPRAAVLIGGASKRFRLTGRIAAYLERRLDDLLARNVSLMITVSRRTPEPVRAALRARFVGHARVWFFDGEGENPYFAFLAAADWIFVTEESTNMLVEAAGTGRPVYILPMEGRPGKFSRLHAALEGRGIARPYLGRLDSWAYPPLDETARIAGLILERRKATTDTGEPA
jgi:hypothetical protein